MGLFGRRKGDEKSAKLTAAASKPVNPKLEIIPLDSGDDDRSRKIEVKGRLIVPWSNQGRKERSVMFIATNSARVNYGWTTQQAKTFSSVIHSLLANHTNVNSVKLTKTKEGEQIITISSTAAWKKPELWKGLMENVINDLQRRLEHLPHDQPIFSNDECYPKPPPSMDKILKDAKAAFQSKGVEFTQRIELQVKLALFELEDRLTAVSGHGGDVEGLRLDFNRASDGEYMLEKMVVHLTGSCVTACDSKGITSTLSNMWISVTSAIKDELNKDLELTVVDKESNEKVAGKASNGRKGLRASNGRGLLGFLAGRGSGTSEAESVSDRAISIHLQGGPN